MQYHVELSRDAQKSLANTDLPLRGKILRVLDALAGNPFIGKKLHGELKEYWAIRAWPFRIIYKIKRKQLVVFVLMVKHRKDAYR